MGVWSDLQILEGVVIEPMLSKKVSLPGIISFGVSSYGYDLRLGSKFKVVSKQYLSELLDLYPDLILDPKNIDPRLFRDFEGEYIDLPPHAFCLAESIEYLEIPREVIAVVVGKSTYARVGAIVNVTPLEPAWKGKVTIEISNTTDLTVRLYAGEGIAQALFIRGDKVCGASYADGPGGGRYQDQAGIELPKVV